MRARATRAWRRSASASRSTPTDPAAVGRSRRPRSTPDLVVVGARGPARGRRRRRGRTPRAASRSAPTPRPRRLEGSKAWMKDVLAAAGVPTARYARVQRRPRRTTAFAFLETLPGPLRREDRRARGGQGRGRHRVDRRGARRGARVPLGRRVRRRGPHVRDRGRPERARGLAVRRCATADDALPIGAAQDHKRVVRRRHGPEHRRHGRVLAGSRSSAADVVDEMMERAIAADARTSSRARRRVPRRRSTAG